MDEQKTIGRWGPRTTPGKVVYGPRQYQILFTRGDELMTPTNYRASFDQSLQRALGGGSQLGDYEIGRAFSVSACAYTCVEYRAGTTAAVPLMVVDPHKNKMENTPLSYFAANSAAIMSDVVRSLLGWGRMYLRKRYNAKGWPTGLEWVNPQTIREITGNNLQVVAYDIRNAVTNEIEHVPVNQVIYKQVFDPDPAGMGQSKFEVAWRAMGVEQGVVTYAAAFFINGAAPDGFLSFEKPLNDEEFGQARADWQQFKGAKNSHRTAVMPGGAKWNPIQAANKDLAMVELKDSEREDICAIMDTDPTLVGMKGTADPLSANSTYSAVEVAHIRRVTIPMLQTIILEALNTQWAHTDFDQKNTYTLAVDENGIPALTEANLMKAEAAINLVSTTPLLDYNEGRKLIGMPGREDGYFARKPDDALAMWRDTGVTLSELRKLVGMPNLLPGLNGDYVNVSGVGLMPVSEIPNLWRYRLLVAPSVYNSQLITGEPLPQPVNPNTVVPDASGAKQIEAPQDTQQIADPVAPPIADGEPALPPGTLTDGRSGILLLAMPNQPDLINLQGRVKQIMGDVPVEWNEPGDFHVTLVYMPSMTDEQVMALTGAIKDFEVPELSLRVGQLNVFDNLGNHALHFRVSRNTDLVEFQDSLYQTCQILGIPMSAYSNPGDYKPHITMGYSEQPIKRIVFNSSLKVIPTELRFIVDDQIIYQSAHNPPATVKASRSAMTLSVGISFADHTFVKQARRKLSDALTEQGITNVEWIPDADWRVSLMQTDEWTPNSVSTLLKDADYAEARKFDMVASRCVVDASGLNIYLSLTGDVETLRKAVQMDMSGAGVERSDISPAPGILLAKLGAASATLSLPIFDPLPLVANNLTLYLGNEAYHSWPLRGVPAAQQKELSAWRRAASNKGAEYDFRTEALSSWAGVRAVRDMLDAGVDIEEAFTIGEALLREEITWRAYPDTAQQFTEELLSLFAAGQQNEINRKQFGPRMRSILNRLGLVAFRDGMNEVGYDPESLSPEELSVFKGWLSQQSAYVTNLGAEIFKQGITENEVRTRADLWTQNSLYQIRMLGIAVGQPMKMFKRKFDPSAEHCKQCKMLDGQVHPIKEWVERKMLPGQNCDCGPGCKCGLVETTDAERGNWLG